MMIRSNSDSGVNLNWTFRSNAFWGENIQGVWSVKMCDRFGEIPGLGTLWQ